MTKVSPLSPFLGKVSLIGFHSQNQLKRDTRDTRDTFYYIILICRNMGKYITLYKSIIIPFIYLYREKVSLKSPVSKFRKVLKKWAK